MNSFKELQEVEEQEVRQDMQALEDIERELWGNLGFLRMLGDVADIYLGRVVDVMIAASNPADTDLTKIHDDPLDED